MFKTQYNFDCKDPKHFETPTGVSETIPDMSYSIQELFDKYRVGLMPNIALKPLYPNGDDPDFDDIDGIDSATDLTDIDDEIEFAMNVRQSIENQRNKENINNKEVEASVAKQNDQN